MKRCSKCNRNKDYSEFHRQTSSKDGFHYWCKKCRSAYDSDRYDKRRKLPVLKIDQVQEKRECRKCRRMKQFADYLVKGKKHTYCNDCRKERGYNANFERHGITPEQFEKLLNSQNGVCAICGNPERTRKRLSIDHDHACCPGIKTCGKCIRGLLCFR